MLGRGLVYSAAYDAWSGHSNAKLEGRGRCRGENRQGVGVAADDVEASLNEMDGVDTGALESATLLGSNSTEK